MFTKYLNFKTSSLLFSCPSRVIFGDGDAQKDKDSYVEIPLMVVGGIGADEMAEKISKNLPLSLKEDSDLSKDDVRSSMLNEKGDLFGAKIVESIENIPDEESLMGVLEVDFSETKRSLTLENENFYKALCVKIIAFEQLIKEKNAKMQYSRESLLIDTGTKIDNLIRLFGETSGGITKKELEGKINSIEDKFTNFLELKKTLGDFLDIQKVNNNISSSVSSRMDRINLDMYNSLVSIVKKYLEDNGIKTELKKEELLDLVEKGGLEKELLGVKFNIVKNTDDNKNSFDFYAKRMSKEDVLKEYRRVFPFRGKDSALDPSITQITAPDLFTVGVQSDDLKVNDEEILKFARVLLENIKTQSIPNEGIEIGKFSLRLDYLKNSIGNDSDRMDRLFIEIISKLKNNILNRIEDKGIDIDISLSDITNEKLDHKIFTVNIMKKKMKN